MEASAKCPGLKALGAGPDHVRALLGLEELAVSLGELGDWKSDQATTVGFLDDGRVVVVSDEIAFGGILARSVRPLSGQSTARQSQPSENCDAKKFEHARPQIWC